MDNFHVWLSFRCICGHSSLRENTLLLKNAIVTETVRDHSRDFNMLKPRI